jgi:hypothetical protein
MKLDYRKNTALKMGVNNMTDMLTLKGTITNSCTCVSYDEDKGDFAEAPECWGDCWEYSLEDFANVTESLRNDNPTDYWKVENLRLWNGEVSGHFEARTVEDLLRGMTVRSEWSMSYEIFTDRIEYSLSHHDSPTGSTSVLRPVEAEEYEERYRW